MPFLSRAAKALGTVPSLIFDEPERVDQSEPCNTGCRDAHEEYGGGMLPRNDTK